MPNPFCSAPGHMMYGGQWFGIWFQLLVVLLFFLIVWWILRGSRPSQYSTQGLSAEEILKKRYAAGELTKKQFDDMKKDIGA